MALLWVGSICAQQGSVEDPVLGKMGDVEIKASDIRRILDAQPPELRKQITGASELDRLVRNELVRQSLLMEARSKGWDKKPDVALMMERAKEQALLQIYVSDLARPPMEYPTEEDIGTRSRRPTLLFNGYGEYVADLYKGLEKERLYV